MKNLIKKLEDQITESESSQFEVGEQRERNHRYYTLQPLGNEIKGRSQYIDPTVLDSVESTKSLFDETFLSNRQAVKFKPSGSQPADEANAKTAYANYTLRKNKHEQLFRDGWHDAFVAKRMVMSAHWKEDSKEISLNVEGATQRQLQAIVMQHAQREKVISVDATELQPGPRGQTVSGRLTIKVDDSHVALELVQPEKYYRDPLAPYPWNAQWNVIEDEVPRGDLIRDGYDPEQVNNIGMDYRFRSGEEDAARKAHDKSWTRRMQFDRDDNQEHVVVYRTWTWCNLLEDDADYDDLNLSFQPADEIRLYEIHWVKGEVLRWADGTHAIREAEDCCFFEWCEYKVSHAEFGLCSADIHAHAQKTNSTLKRLIIDNQQMRNNTRWEAAINAIKNPADLQEGRIGGIIWSRAPGSVQPLAAPELSPLTFNVLEMMRQDTERRDGYSALGKGMNDDAIRYQNSDNMVDRLGKAGTKRPMKKARDWAQNFLIPLCQYIVYLGMENDERQREMEVKGRMIPVVPSQWRDDELEMEVAVALTPDEGREHAGNLMTMHSVMKEDPDLQQLYGVKQKHALMDEVFDALGIADTTPFMMRPDSPEYAQAMQNRQRMMQEQQRKQDAVMQTSIQLRTSEDRRAWEEFEWNKSIDMDNQNIKADELKHSIRKDTEAQELDEDKFEHDKVIDFQEVAIERAQKRAASVG